MIKVLIVDDQEIIRESLELMLNSVNNIEVIGTAPDGRDAITFVEKDKPDVILMDIRMPIMNGIESMKVIKANYPNIKVIILTTFDDDEYIFESLKHGANGFLLKGVSIKILAKSVELVHQEDAMMDTKARSKVLSLFSQIAKRNYLLKKNSHEDLLTNHELKIIQAVGQGLSDEEIASELKVTLGIVHHDISSVLKKLDLGDPTQIAIFAIQSSIMLRRIEN
ncbi:MAG: response regulator transcription factor [Vallitaleaceae bacterium]|nr:response regulator transcription factor [Vallitaleaceae bacterium]